MRRRFFKAEKIKDIRVLVRRAVKLYSDKIAFKELGSKKKILEYSFSRLEKDMNAFGTMIINMGMKGQHFAILGENSYYWVVSFLSIVNGAGVVVPIDKEMTSEDIAKLLKKSDTDVVICSKTFAQTVLSILPKVPNVKKCIVMNSEQEYPELLSMKKLIEEGNKLLEGGNREYLDSPIDREAMCEIVFTSGTTGANKGVMLSHKNIMAVVYGEMSIIKVKGTSFSVLPINHTYELNCHVLGGIYAGLTICFNDSLKRLVENINLFKPDMSVMVPLLLESIYKSIWRKSEQEGLARHLSFGIKYSNLLRRFGIDARRIFFKPILEKFGGNLYQIICGGAPLRSEIIKGISDLGIEVINGYGITECGPLVAGNSIRAKKLNSVGRIIPDCRVRISEKDEKGVGEIQVKGDNVMLGYYKDPESTKLTFAEDGWFKTGDLGYLDKDIFLYINGRKKNLIILGNGKNVHPEELEDLIIEKLPYVKEVVVYAALQGGGKECICASVYMDEEYLKNSEIVNIDRKLKEDMDLLNHELPLYKRISNVSISKTEFEKTTTRKIKRNNFIGREMNDA